MNAFARSHLYAEWRACERAKIAFSGIGNRIWDELNWWEQFHLISYDQIRQLEELELRGI